MKQKYDSTLGKIMTAVLLIALIILAVVPHEKIMSVTGKNLISKSSSDNAKTVVIDPGHGGGDSGKVGINGVLEKDINLSIALRVKKLLEAQDITVYITREDDKGFYPDGGDNKKMQDMKKRVEYINEINPPLCVSVHQNSFTSEKESGAQVFYHEKSESAKQAAEIMQDQLKKTLDPDNRRETKNNTSYYLLKKTECPTIIVESGFLSNWEEAEKLKDSDYQEKVAWAIHMGVLRYFNIGKQNVS